MGKIANLARDLRRELQRAKYEKFADAISKISMGKPFEHYQECYDLLGAMVKFRCDKGCRNGGGPPFCEIRKCCEEKKISGCWECNEPEICKKLTFLVPVHGNAHLRNISMIRKKGINGFIFGKKVLVIP